MHHWSRCPGAVVPRCLLSFLLGQVFEVRETPWHLGALRLNRLPNEEPPGGAADWSCRLELNSWA